MHAAAAMDMEKLFGAQGGVIPSKRLETVIFWGKDIAFETGQSWYIDWVEWLGRPKASQHEKRNYETSCLDDIGRRVSISESLSSSRAMSQAESGAGVPTVFRLPGAFATIQEAGGW